MTAAAVQQAVCESRAVLGPSAEPSAICSGSPHQVCGDGHHRTSRWRASIYLAVVLDWATRRVLSWRLSITMRSSLLRRDAARMRWLATASRTSSTRIRLAIHRTAFTGVQPTTASRSAWTQAWRRQRVCRTALARIKYDEVYLRAYGTVSEARSSIGRYLHFYNSNRPAVLTAARRIKPTHPAATPHGSQPGRPMTRISVQRHLLW